MKRVGRGLALFLISAIVVSCVSKSKYDDLAGQSEHFRKRAAELRKQNQELQARVDILEKEMSTYTVEKGLLQARVDSAVRHAAEDIQKLQSMNQQLVKSLENEIKQGEINISQLYDRLSVKILDQVLFLSGESAIRPRGKQVLARLAETLKKITDQWIIIEGHTDNVPIGPKLQDRYPTNWELSSARATVVVRHLIEELGIDPGRISSAGYGEYKPVAPNTTKEGRTKNRRIEIILRQM
ncbi:MAG: OmpA family protein [Fidelibacterota bacterium]|nr:MAG: OmpA family protein [Candidatus Neomarinimicrobiota bacterium]